MLPGIFAGATKVIDVSLTTVKVLDEPAIDNAVAPLKFAPVNVTLKPPASSPLSGEMFEIVGAV